MSKMTVKISHVLTTLKIVASKSRSNMRIFAVATNKKARDNIYVTGFVVNVIKKIPGF